MATSNCKKDNVVIVTMVRTPYFAWRMVTEHGLNAGNVTELFVPENVGLNVYGSKESYFDKFVSILRSPVNETDENTWTEDMVNTPVPVS